MRRQRKNCFHLCAAAEAAVGKHDAGVPPSLGDASRTCNVGGAQYASLVPLSMEYRVQSSAWMSPATL